jgi:hydroxypyruvate isomerase
MPRFAANISLMFTEWSFLDRIAAAADAGFEAVECQFPYDHAPDAIAAALARAGIGLVLHNLPAGDFAAGDRGLACDPGRVEAFRAGVPHAIVMAQALGCPRLNCLSGIAPEGVDPVLLTRTFVDNLAFAAEACDAAGIHLGIEAINPIDIPGFFLTTTRQGLAVLDAVGHPGLTLQYDIYHMQITEGDLARTLTRHRDRIGHVQFADTPGRHEPGTGEINLPFLFSHLDAIGYTGWVGAEYRPRTETSASLGWFQPWRRQ